MEKLNINGLQVEQCTEVIKNAYEKYKKEKGEGAHYDDADFFDSIEKDTKIITFYSKVFLFAYQKFIEEQEKIELSNKLQKIKKFLLQISNTLKKII